MTTATKTIYVPQKHCTVAGWWDVGGGHDTREDAIEHLRFIYESHQRLEEWRDWRHFRVVKRETQVLETVSATAFMFTETAKGV